MRGRTPHRRAAAVRAHAWNFLHHPGDHANNRRMRPRRTGPHHAHSELFANGARFGIQVVQHFHMI